MKRKITRKELKGYNVYQCPYAAIQCIMNGRTAQFYNSGVYGWNFDAYYLGGIFILTGYRNMTGKKVPIDVIEKYEDFAKNIIRTGKSWEDMEEKLDKNLRDFMKAIQQ